MTHEIIETDIMGFLPNQRSSLALGRKTSAMQNFIDVNISKTGNDLLIKQGRLQGCGFFPECASEILAAEFIAKRFHTNIFQKFVGRQFFFVEDIHDTEAAVIGVNNLHPIIEREDNMVMGTGTSVCGARFKIELSQILRVGIATQNGKASGHAEMHQEAMAIIKVNQNIFGPAAEPQDLPAF